MQISTVLAPVLLATVLLGGLVPAAQAADLSVTVTGIRNGQGILRMAVFDNARDFPTGDDVQSLDLPARAGTLGGHFRNLAPGTYALALLHDEDGNGGMSYNRIGWPKEGFGFSNDAKVILIPPKFAAAAFEVPAEGAAITLRVQYWGKN